MSVVLLGLSLFVVSNKDDDDNRSTTSNIMNDDSELLLLQKYESYCTKCAPFLIVYGCQLAMASCRCSRSKKHYYATTLTELTGRILVTSA